jgi:hypothetical protein
MTHLRRLTALDGSSTIEPSSNAGDDAVGMRHFALTGLLLFAMPAFAAEPVKRIDIYVLPFYESAKSPDGRPTGAVGKSFDERLASTRREDIAAVRDAIRADPQLVTPMTMMVLAIRLYDVGLRDDAVFWFYAAKDRYATLAVVLDMSSRELAQVKDVVRNFATLAGPTINGYAFCDLGRQRETRFRALDWVEGNLYKALFLTQLPARPGDRAANLKGAIASIRSSALQEAAYLEKPESAASFRAMRKESAADEMYCWK